MRQKSQAGKNVVSTVWEIGGQGEQWNERWAIGVVVVTLIREHTTHQKCMASLTLFLEYIFHVLQVFYFQLLTEDSFQGKTCLIIKRKIVSPVVYFFLCCDEFVVMNSVVFTLLPSYTFFFLTYLL